MKTGAVGKARAIFPDHGAGLVVELALAVGLIPRAGLGRLERDDLDQGRGQVGVVGRFLEQLAEQFVRLVVEPFVAVNLDELARQVALGERLGLGLDELDRRPGSGRPP